MILERSAERREPGDTGADDDAAFWIFRRCLVDLQLAAGRRAEAVAGVRRMFEACWAREEDDADRGTLVAASLIWAVEHGLPETVQLLEARWPGLAIDDPVTGYAAAVALAAGGDRERAGRLAEAAGAAARKVPGDFTTRLQCGLLLAKSGAIDWAVREYRAVIDDPATPAGEFALAGILFSEFLHDQGRDEEAADVLRRVVAGRAEAAAEAEEAIRRLDRDPAELRGRPSSPRVPRPPAETRPLGGGSSRRRCGTAAATSTP